MKNTNLLIGLIYAGKMSLLYIQQNFLYDQIRKHAWYMKVGLEISSHLYLST